MGVRWRAAGAVSGDDSGSSRLCVSVASSVGIGVFLIVGYVAKHVAGPATLLSIVIAAVIAVLSALCNIELSQRLPRKASPYTFSHVCLGRFASFLTGWTLILEYAVAFALVAKGVGLYIDTLLEDAMQIAFRSVAPLSGGEVFGTYFDFFGAAVVLLVGSIFLLDLQRRKWVDSGALVISVAVVIFIITAGSFNANLVNWTANPDGDSAGGTGTDQTPTPARGFFPFGVMATFRGAALCTFAFIGIEMLMRSKRDTMRSVSFIGMLSFAMILLSLLGCTTVLTLMWPHYLMHVNVPFPYAFAAYQFNLAKWIISIAATVILSTSLWTLMFPLKRQILALAEDGLLPFAEHNRCAMGATLLTVVTISSLFAGLFSMGQLIDLLSVGTLLMFIVVAVAIVLLRFSHQLEIGSISTIDVAELRTVDFAVPPPPPSSSMWTSSSPTTTTTIPTISGSHPPVGRNGSAAPGFGSAPGGNRKNTIRMWMRQIVGRATDDDGGGGRTAAGAGAGGDRRPTRRSFRVVKSALAVQLAAMVAVALTVRYAGDNIYNLDVWAVALAVLGVLVVLLGGVVTALQPQRVHRNYYKVPLVAVTAGCTMFACVLLVGQLDYAAWVRFGVWLCIGCPVFVVARRCRRERKWRTTGGISKIQSMHSRGYGAGLAATTTTTTSPLAVQTAAQMVEITEVDEAEQLDMYAVPTPALTDAADAADVGAGSGRTWNNHNNSNNNDDRSGGDADSTAADDAANRTAAVKLSSSSSSVAASTSRTPSPSSQFDDIALVSDIIESLSERKEPDGKTYFVDDVNVSAPALATMVVATAATAAATVTAIDNSVPEKCPETQTVLGTERSDATTSTIALVHVRHGGSDVETETDDEIDDNGHNKHSSGEFPIPDRAKNTDISQAPLAAVRSASNFDYSEQLRSLDSESSDGDRMPSQQLFIHGSNTDSDADDDDETNAPNEEASSRFRAREFASAHAKTPVDATLPAAVADAGDVASADASSNDFKERLSKLLNQNRTLGRQTAATVKKMTASAQPTSATGADAADDADALPEEPEPSAVGAARFVVTNVAPTVDQSPPGRIPPPPIFIANLYNSSSLSRLPTPDCDYNDDATDEAVIQPSLRRAPSDSAIVETPKPDPGSTDASSANDDLTADDLKASFREKLELIFRRGVPARVSQNLSGMQVTVGAPPVDSVKSTAGQPDVHGASSAAGSSEHPTLENDAEEDNKKSSAGASQPPQPQPLPQPQPPQTMHQALFKDVLKSITTDGSRGPPTAPTPSVRRALSAKPATIEDARNSLRHVELTVL